MKVLVVGGGGREHALAWKIATSPEVEEVLCAPGNAGTARVARNVAPGIDLSAAGDMDVLVELAAAEGVGLVVIGPEDPLCLGLADRMQARGIPVYGPGASGARLEGSKLFAKELLDRHRIPTASWRRFDRAGAAKSYLEGVGVWPQVVKADGLAAGKGVFICADSREACSVVDRLMEERKLGEAGAQIVVEEFLEGQEISIHAITDGQTLVILEPAVDYKPIGDGDTGPNTGGMGIYSPAPFVNQRLMRQVEQRVLLPTLHALRIEDVDYRGTLYAGLILTEAGPRVLEFNCRFGDPETQALMRRLSSDLVPYLVAASEGRLHEVEPPEWDARHCVGVVAAAEGYPDAARRGDVISGIDEAEQVEQAVVFQAGTRLDGGQLLTDGGRVLCTTSLGETREEARANAYAADERIRWHGKYRREDIGAPTPVRHVTSDEEPGYVGPIEVG